MTYQVSPTDPVVSVDELGAEVSVATKLKSAGVTSQAQLTALIAGINTTNCPGMSNAACQALQALLGMIKVAP